MAPKKPKLKLRISKKTCDSHVVTPSESLVTPLPTVKTYARRIQQFATATVKQKVNFTCFLLLIYYW